VNYDNNPSGLLQGTVCLMGLESLLMGSYLFCLPLRREGLITGSSLFYCIAVVLVLSSVPVMVKHESAQFALVPYSSSVLGFGYHDKRSVLCDKSVILPCDEALGLLQAVMKLDSFYIRRGATRECFIAGSAWISLESL
jgi:hypothetical protein